MKKQLFENEEEINRLWILKKLIQIKNQESIYQSIYICVYMNIWSS